MLMRVAAHWWDPAACRRHRRLIIAPDVRRRPIVGGFGDTKRHHRSMSHHNCGDRRHCSVGSRSWREALISSSPNIEFQLGTPSPSCPGDGEGSNGAGQGSQPPCRCQPRPSHKKGGAGRPDTCPGGPCHRPPTPDTLPTILASAKSPPRCYRTMDWAPVVEPFVEGHHLDDFTFNIPAEARAETPGGPGAPCFPTVLSYQVRASELVPLG